VPEKNGQIELTTTGWTPLTGNNAVTITGNEFDYIYTKYMRVYSRYTITENFGRSVNPSDHYPQLIVCSLSTNDGPRDLHVDFNASPGGDGSVTAPFNTITAALEVARIGDTVKITEGNYAESLTPGRSVVLEGGYDTSFTHQTGMTTIDCATLNGRPVNVPLYYDLSISNFEFANYGAASRDKDGAIYMCGSELRLNNVIFSANKAVVNGGALYADCHSIDMNRCIFNTNEAQEVGGGAYMKATADLNIIDCVFSDNKAKSGSAAYVIGTDVAKVMRSTFIGNTSSQFGTFYIAPYDGASSYNFVDNTFINNELNSPSGIATLTRTYGGSAIYAKPSQSGVQINLAHCTVAGNKATFAGSNKANYGAAALNITGGRVVLMNNIIAGNYSDSGIGDIAVSPDATIAKEQYNLCTAATSTNITHNTNDFLCNDIESGTRELTSLLDGTIDTDGHFTATATDNGGLTPTVKLTGTTYGSKDVNILTSNLRMVETSFNIDLNNDGRIMGSWLTDQRGETRNAASVPGACDYVELSGIDNITSDTTCELITLGPNLYFSKDEYVYVYDMAGRRIACGASNDTGTIVDLSGLNRGGYILSSPSANYRVIVK
ncbi:MAG: DUF1565 domain-containing protein, partial [Bacteroides sp.]|nr:DUF1565 domain-containing protein [Bacteroides sp.]